MVIKRQWLHDAAKFGAGLVVADFITLIWLSQQYILPQTFMGLPVGQSSILPSMIIDFFLLLILIHYAWNIGKLPRLRENTYLLIVGVIFAVVTLAHLVRVLYQTDIIIYGWEVPIFLSWFGIAVAGYLTYASFHLAMRRK